MNWAAFWKIFLLFTLCGYSILVVVVIIGGTRNVIDMFKDLTTPTNDELT